MSWKEAISITSFTAAKQVWITLEIPSPAASASSDFCLRVLIEIFLSSANMFHTLSKLNVGGHDDIEFGDVQSGHGESLTKSFALQHLISVIERVRSRSDFDVRHTRTWIVWRDYDRQSGNICITEISIWSAHRRKKVGIEEVARSSMTDIMVFPHFCIGR